MLGIEPEGKKPVYKQYDFGGQAKAQDLLQTMNLYNCLCCVLKFIVGKTKVFALKKELAFAGSSGIPSGIICAWSGTVNNVPSGWVLCNGQNNTPNLSGRFILGYGGTYTTLKETGGEETHTLSEAEMPSHSHTARARGSWGEDGYHNWLIGGGYIHNDGSTLYNVINDAGSSQPHNNMPPYFVLAYIMKL